MTKRIRLRNGFTVGRDLCRVGYVINGLNDADFYVSPESNPLEVLKKGLEQNKDEIELPYLCLESEHLKERGIVEVRVYDYLKEGECILNIKFNDRIDGFLRGCYNLATALKNYLKESERELESKLNNG